MHPRIGAKIPTYTRFPAGAASEIERRISNLDTKELLFFVRKCETVLPEIDEVHILVYGVLV